LRRYVSTGREGTERRYSPVNYVTRASHWLQLDAPEKINVLLLDYLS
jgi:hypothetical protein